MLWWLPALAVWTGLFSYWFLYATTVENDTGWWTSEPVQTITGIAALAGIAAMLIILTRALVRGLRRWLT